MQWYEVGGAPPQPVQQPGFKPDIHNQDQSRIIGTISYHESFHSSMQLERTLPGRPSAEYPSLLSHQQQGIGSKGNITLPECIQSYADDQIDSGKGKNRSKCYHLKRIIQNRNFKILSVGWRCFDSISDFMLMITLLWILVFSPSVTVTFLSPSHGSFTSRVIFNYTSGAGSSYCGFRKHINIADTCKSYGTISSAAYQDTIKHNEYLQNPYFSDDMWKILLQILSSS